MSNLIPEQTSADQERLVVGTEMPIAELGGVRVIGSVIDHGESDSGSDSDDGSDSDAAVADSRSGLHNIAVSLVVSFDLTRTDLIERPNLKRLEFDLGSEIQVLNFANPFTRGNAKKNAPRGAARPVLDVIANLVSDINNANVTILARDNDVASHLSDICQRFTESLTGSLPALPTQVIYEEDEENDMPGVLMRDLIDVNVWSVSDKREDGLGSVHNIYINLIINAMPAFESEEPHRFFVQGLNAVESFMASAGVELSPYATMRFDTDLLDQPIINDLFSFFIDEENGGWRAVGRRAVELGKSAHNEFVLPGQTSLLYGEAADLLLFYYPSDEEEGLDGEVGGDQAAAAE